MERDRYEGGRTGGAGACAGEGFRRRQDRRRRLFVETIRARERELPALYRYQLEQRLRGLRHLVAMRKKDLKAALYSLEEFERRLHHVLEDEDTQESLCSQGIIATPASKADA